MSEQPEALQLLQHMEDEWPEDWDQKRIKSELRRLHEVNADLLAALQSMVVAFAPPEFEREGASDEYLMDWFPEWFKARAAIAKATGQA